MQNFDFRNPTKIVFGEDTVRRIGEEINRDRHKLVLLIAGGGSIRNNGVYATVRKSLSELGINRLECWGVQPNPTLEKTREMISTARRAGVDALRAKTASWGGAITLKELGVEKNRIEAIAEAGYGTGRTGSIRKLGVEDIQAILESAYS